MRDCVAAARCVRAGKAGCALSCARRHPAPHPPKRPARPRSAPASWPAQSSAAAIGPERLLASGPVHILRRSRVRRRFRPCSKRLCGVASRGNAAQTHAAKSAQSRTQNPRGRGALRPSFRLAQASPEGPFVRLRPRVRTLREPVCERSDFADQTMPHSGDSHQR